MVNTILKEADLFCPDSVRINFTMGSQHFFGQFAKRLFVKLGHTRKAMLLVQDSLSVLVPLRGCKRSRCKKLFEVSIDEQAGPL
ncbi:hypothetical protein EFP65_07160 [Lacticaseibacillus paracasei]|nr:hypothetical protein LPEG9_16115 [Lacticaseibacillus paracasei]KAB1963079.1 hypothetical protein F8272_15245 [Lacticaseibacillus paracasei]MCT3332057.1 hypothetical protein [Lacticaseibacillus paracasei]